MAVEAELGHEHRVLRRDVAPVGLPLRLPGLLALLRVGVGRVGDGGRVDRARQHLAQLVGPVEAGHDHDRRGVVRPHDRDDLLEHRLPLRPREPAERAVVVGRLVEELVEHDHGVVPVVAGDLAPELERLLARGVVHGVLHQLGPQVADDVPVHHHGEAGLPRPADALVEEREVAPGAPRPPGHRVDRDAHDVRPPRLDFLEDLLVPATRLLELVGVGDRHAAEHDRLPGRVHELVALHAEGAAGLRRLRARGESDAGEDAESGERHPECGSHGRVPGAGIV